MKLPELFRLEDLDTEIREGFVKVQVHPTLPLSILNYTDKATYERRWNNVTSHCRGLIIHMDTKEIIARGPRKFFNYGEPSATEYPLDTLVRLTRKEDGSLGIGWEYEGTYGIATRGSFTSEQAVHATAGMTGWDEDNIRLAEITDYSRMWEIVYPENRIVLDYAGRDENIPLGTVDNRTGLIAWRPNHVLVGGLPVVMTLAEAIALPIPDDEEGYVLDILDEYLNVVDHLKLKGDRYKELHSAIFGLSEKVIWEHWIKDTEDAFIEGLPDELQPWAEAVVDRLLEELLAKAVVVAGAMDDMRSQLGDDLTRKEQAQYLMEFHKDVAPAVFALLDNNFAKYDDWLYKQIKPGHVPFSINKESVTL